ncbi:TetR family transcriptional regulator [Stackebrandtia endophytica]|uniref:TetR family transcriptional regulator n=1 Tax=Stackebrandtia endophytica TaxID=1496996 RepID=A0A543AS57_9ACTN|nr:TetR/AcrR family transcriptional regulator [Stackebrandtia endophytica]TQL75408.1 TetR family transcriptional regulator [Stackebrandtia endophytica]
MSEQNSDERRTRIIRAVWQVIASEGMGGVSMRNVAAAADVSVGQIQYWFRSKDELVKASLEVMLSAAHRRYLTDTENTDDREALWQLVGHAIPRAESARAGVSVFHHYIAAGINHPSLAQLLAEAKDGAEREAGRLMADIVPGHPEPGLAARALLAAADGLAMRVLIGSLTGAQAERTLRAEIDRLLTPSNAG